MRIRSLAGSGVRLIRDSWLVLGISLIVLIGFEGCFRAQGEMRRWLRTPQNIVAQESGAAWFNEYLEEAGASVDLRWEPYVYFRRRPFRGKYINVDSLGLRRTIPGAPQPGAEPRIFFFGGSTLWGTFQRDEATIPSLVMRDLANRWGIVANATNFGETGYVITTEVVALLRELQRGNVPDVIVFYDGINDVAAAVQNGTAGGPQNEFNRVRDFEFGKAVFSWRTDASSELRAAGLLANAGLKRIQFVERLKQLLIHTAQDRATDDSVLAADILNRYERTAKATTSLAESVGAEAVFYWQPTLHTTQKRWSPFERLLLEGIQNNSYHSQLQRVHRLIVARLDDRTSEQLRGRFTSLHHILANDTAPVFADMIGHTYERANAPIAARLAEDIARVLRARKPAPARASTGRSGALQGAVP
jgi:hypothetical protein